MTYSIGEVARMLGLTIYTLRYYDKEGLLPNLKRTPSGTRIFVDSDIDTLKVIECLKNTGVPIKEIKNFIDWCAQGDSTLQQRYDMFIERKAIVEAQLEKIQKTADAINFKCWYYKTALDAGTESIHKKTEEKS
ncbi:MerR family transcriptional regulator [Lacrimispora sp.]|uniref:MerR family transcriptional regulator n=1 Tax=Lacrimispora sp. TaxID=2719234 RepID=UPI0034605402